MSDLGEQKPSEGGNSKPPKGNWEAAPKQRFFDLKFSHYVEIILTAALVGIAYFQYTVYARQAGIMQTQSNIADQQNKISEATQRAFLGISRVKVDRPKRNDPYVISKITPVIENSGATPAIDVSLVFIDPVIDVITTPTGMDFNEYKKLAQDIGAPRDPDELMDRTYPVAEGDPFVARLLSHGTVGPKSPLITSGLTTEYSGGNLQEGFFLYGSIRYFDVFEPKKQHVTKFCFSMVSLMASPRTDLDMVPPFLCAHWNCTDDYCKADKEAYDLEWSQAVTKWKAEQDALPPLPPKSSK